VAQKSAHFYALSLANQHFITQTKYTGWPKKVSHYQNIKKNHIES